MSNNLEELAALTDRLVGTRRMAPNELEEIISAENNISIACHPLRAGVSMRGNGSEILIVRNGEVRATRSDGEKVLEAGSYSYYTNPEPYILTALTDAVILLLSAPPLVKEVL